MMYSFLRYPIILGFNEPDRGNRAFGADLRFTFGVIALFLLFYMVAIAVHIYIYIIFPFF